MNAGNFVSDEQMNEAHDVIMGQVDAMLGICSPTGSRAYLASFGEEYERGERESATERPF